MDFPHDITLILVHHLREKHFRQTKKLQDKIKAQNAIILTQSKTLSEFVATCEGCHQFISIADATKCDDRVNNCGKSYCFDCAIDSRYGLTCRCCSGYYCNDCSKCNKCRCYDEDEDV